MSNNKTQIKVETEKAKGWGSTFQRMSWWKKEQVEGATIMVVGSGALGNEVLKNLTLLGVGAILIVDYDVIEYHNLNRSILFRESDSDANILKVDAAAKAIRTINPNVKIKTINGNINIDVGLGVYRRVDVVIGCLDNRLARLSINKHAFWMDKTWIDGAIENLSGQLNVYRPGVACYESGLSPVEFKQINQKRPCKGVAQQTISAGSIPTTPISSSIIAAMQVQEALKVVHGNDRKLMLGKTLYYDGMNNECFTFENTPPKDEAESSFMYDPIVPGHKLSANMTIGETLAALSELLEDDNPVIKLKYELITEVTPESTGKGIPVLIAELHVDNAFIAKYTESSTEKLYMKGISDIDKSFPMQDKTLQEIGIPFLDIIEVFAGDDIHYVELSGDEDFFTFE